MKFSWSIVRNTAGLALGLALGSLVMTPTVSALSLLPSLSLVSPGNATNVSGIVTFVAMASGEGLSSLQFKVDGNSFSAPITQGSCRATFDTRATSDGPHIIQAEGRDDSGNSVMTMPATIFVNNLAPAITGVSVSNITSTSATVSWVTEVAADTQVMYGVTSAYSAASPRIFALVQSHTQGLANLTPSTTYHFQTQSVAQNGIASVSGDYTFATIGAPGTLPTPTPNPTPTPGPGIPTPTPTPTPGPGIPTPTPTPTVPSHGAQTGPAGALTLPNVRHTPQMSATQDSGFGAGGGGGADSPAQSRLTRGANGGATQAASTAGANSSTNVGGGAGTRSVAPASQAPSKSNAMTAGTKTGAASGVTLVLVPSKTKTTGSCSTPDPYAAKGGVGICVDGTWLELYKSTAPKWHGSKGGGKN
jgi:hypothetical protein